MIPIPPGVHVWLATSRTDMRKGFDSLARQVQETLGRDPHGGQLFVLVSPAARLPSATRSPRRPGEGHLA